MGTPNRLALRLTSSVILAAGLVALVHSLGWRGARFPGFFVLPNQVIPSVALADWSGMREGRPVFQQTLLVVDDAPVASAAESYARAARHAVGDPVRCTLARHAALETRSFPVHALGGGEWVAIFGMYFVSGVFYLLLAAVAAERWREGAVFRGLAAFGWASAAFGFTGMDIYGPGHLFRLHALAESLLPAAAAHLALACPRDRLARRGPLPLVYGMSLALAAIYQLFLYDPGVYVVVHNVAQALIVLPVLAFTVALGLALGDPPAALGAPGARRLLAGALGGIVVPALVLGISGMSGGLVPVNVSAWVGYVFPLAALASLRVGAGARLATA